LFSFYFLTDDHWSEHEPAFYHKNFADLGSNKIGQKICWHGIKSNRSETLITLDQINFALLTLDQIKSARNFDNLRSNKLRFADLGSNRPETLITLDQINFALLPWDQMKSVRNFDNLRLNKLRFTDLWSNEIGQKLCCLKIKWIG